MRRQFVFRLRWLGVALLLWATVATPIYAHPPTLVVDPNHGPLRTIQSALDQARPGTTIVLRPGVYREDLRTQRSGTATAPITISGPRTAVVAGAGSARVVEITHDYYVLDGFTIDGAAADTAPRDKLLYLLGTHPRRGVTGTVITHLLIQNAGGECVRLRSFATTNEIAHNTIRSCGNDDFPNGRWAGGGKNGEGIYVGTSSRQWADGKNPTADPDRSTGNWIHHNTIDTRGNECVEVKEGAVHTIIEHNHCTGNRDPESAGIGSRGNDTIIRFNTISANSGAGVRVGGHTVDGVTYGTNNTITDNTITSNRNGGIKVQVSPQAAVCGNTMRANNGGNAVGTYATTIAPAAPCRTPAPRPAPLPVRPTPTDHAGVPLPVLTVSASGDDGNIAANTRDDDLSTRWSAQGLGSWISYDLGQQVALGEVQVAFYQGTERQARLVVAVSDDGRIWHTAARFTSSGTTDDRQSIALRGSARYVRLIGAGNTENDWTSLSEVVIWGTPRGTLPAGSSDNTPRCAPGGSVSGDDGNIAANTRDDDLSTRWSAQDLGSWICYDLGQQVALGEVQVAFYRGTERQARLVVAVSDDGRTWHTAARFTSSGTTDDRQSIALRGSARYVRLIGAGNTENDWTSLSEVRFVHRHERPSY